jgi:hypothetical protein
MIDNKTTDTNSKPLKRKVFHFSSLFFVFLGVWGYGQTPQINTNLPNVIPPSPSVAALMKFEEIPVSNYTGVPNTSIFYEYQ